MTFRPSVLPDRDNDILSTFTRSFERARQLVRQDQADKRAQQLHDLDVRERESELQNRHLDLMTKIAENPELSFRDISPVQAEIANSLQANSRGEAVAPMIGQEDPNRPFFHPRRAAMPPELFRPGTPQDVQILGDVDGRTLTFSQQMGDRIRRERARAEAEFGETLPEGRRAAEDRRRALSAEDDLATTVRNLIGAGEVTGASGEPITPEQVPSTKFGAELITQERGARQTEQRQVNVARTPRSGQGRSPDEIRLGQARGRILSNFNRQFADETRRLQSGEPIQTKLQREMAGGEAPVADRAQVMERVIRESATTGDITNDEMNQMLQDIPSLIQQAEAGSPSNGSTAGTASTGGLSDAEVDQVVSILRRAGSITEAEVREDLQAEGFSEDEIQQILDAM